MQWSLIRRHVVVLAGEERPGAAEGGDDLVDNEQDLVFLARTARMAFNQPAGGTRTPPDPSIGST